MAAGDDVLVASKRPYLVVLSYNTHTSSFQLEIQLFDTVGPRFVLASLPIFAKLVDVRGNAYYFTKYAVHSSSTLIPGPSIS